MAQGGKLHLVLGLHVSGVHGRVVVEVVGLREEVVVGIPGQLLEGEVEEVLVVGLELNHRAGQQELPIDVQVLAAGQATLGVAGFRPGVGEIEVNPVDFAPLEEVGQVGGVGADEGNIGQGVVFDLSYGLDEDTGVAVAADEKGLGMESRHFVEEGPLAAADFDGDRPPVGDGVQPFPLEGVGFFSGKNRRGDGFGRAGYIS